MRRSVFGRASSAGISVWRGGRRSCLLRCSDFSKSETYGQANAKVKAKINQLGESGRRKKARVLRAAMDECGSALYRLLLLKEIGMVVLKLFGGVLAGALVAGCMTPAETFNRNMMSVSSSSHATVHDYATSIAEYRKTNSEESTIANAKRVTADSLKDPNSAQFRNVRLVPYGPGMVVCGEINGKNGYGGYAGFKPFVAGTTAATFLESSRYADIDAAANAGINAACRAR